VNVPDWPEVREIVDGATEIETGIKKSVAEALVPDDAWLVAMTVTVCAEEMVEGAV
jgi:hypothetical protein